jgi:hypothetical protein
MPYAMRVYSSSQLVIYRLDPTEYDLAKEPDQSSSVPGELTPDDGTAR